MSAVLDNTPDKSTLGDRPDYAKLFSAMLQENSHLLDDLDPAARAVIVPDMTKFNILTTEDDIVFMKSAVAARQGSDRVGYISLFRAILEQDVMIV